MNDLTIIYYTSNYLEEVNPYFLRNTEKQLLRAAGDLPIQVITQKELSINSHFMKSGVNVQYALSSKKERGHLNIYYQILEGCRLAKTPYVAMAEDDILYSFEHFHEYRPKRNKLAYDMAKWSIFTWTNPPMYSFRNKRLVVNSLLCSRDMLIELLEERFERVEQIRKDGWKEDAILSKWGDPGRYEDLLGVKVREREEFYTSHPNIVFSHEHAFGFLNHGKRKRLGDMRATEIPEWGKASDVLKLYYEEQGNTDSNS